MLSFTLTGLPVDADAIASLDDPAANASFIPRFLVANRTVSQLAVVSYLGDDGNPDRSVLIESALIPINTQATGNDTRGILVDPANPGEVDVNGQPRPTRVFLTSRAPSSIVIGQIEPDNGVLHFYDNVPLPVGASRLVRSTYDSTDPDGTKHTHTRIYLTSYDASVIVAYDPDTRRLGDVVRAGRGPYALAIDQARKLGYVANFIDGTIQVLELDPSKGSALYDQIVLTVGVPQGPRQ